MICRPLWTADEAAQATGGENTADWAATGVSIDSRSLQPGDFFIALEGPSFDGHKFIGAAFAAGAAAVMAHRRPEGPTHAGPLLLVEDTLAALKALGVAGRARSQARFIGVTGSVGKTGAKEALKHCLSVQAPSYASVGSLNNHWGVPLSLARMPRKALYGVFEMGMNHPGEIRELTALVRPHVALITAVEAAHSEFFASVTEMSLPGAPRCCSASIPSSACSPPMPMRPTSNASSPSAATPKPMHGSSIARCTAVTARCAP
jgi:UDP-N-acetylmuramoyl-tripeptide--D-alanyl-D-alanine ligase